MTMMSGNVNVTVQNMGDTSLTKVFVGGLAWETQKEAMREHYEKYGDILEAVIISDKLTGRSKGYGFVTFKDPEAAKRACEDPTPIINGRRANCNLAALGARRPPRSSNTSPTPQQQGVNVGPRAVTSPPRTNPVQWYYPQAAPAAAPVPFHHHHHQQQHQAVPFYGYTPAAYVASPEMNYNHKVGYTGGAYMNGHYSQMYQHHHHPGQAMMAASAANTLMPMYPFYHFHQSHTMGLPAHIYSPTPAGPMPTIPALISKPISITPPKAVCLAVE